eukprot:1148297-Pelagomonas_calceolata.AAC.7
MRLTVDRAIKSLPCPGTNTQSAHQIGDAKEGKQALPSPVHFFSALDYLLFNDQVQEMGQCCMGSAHEYLGCARTCFSKQTFRVCTACCSDDLEPVVQVDANTNYFASKTEFRTNRVQPI